MPVDFKEYSRRMDKALEHLQEEFGAVRAGRANAKVLDRITVEYYGVDCYGCNHNTLDLGIQRVAAMDFRERSYLWRAS